MKTIIVKTLLTALIVFALGKVNAVNFSSIKNDTLNCLKIEGVIPAEHDDAPCLVELISYNVCLDSAVLDQGVTKFKFMLKKNTSYTIRITRKGYVTRLVCIDTEVPADVDGIYRFKFTTKLMSIRDSKRLNQDALDFPVALIAYDLQLECFDYCHEYTKMVKHEWYSHLPNHDYMVNVKY